MTAPVAPAFVAQLDPGVGTGAGETDGANEGAAPIEQGLLDKLDQGPRGVIVHADADRPEPSDQEAAFADLEGFQPRYTFESIPAVYGIATDPSTVRALANVDETTFVEDAEKPIEFHLDSATIASRAREVFDPTFDPPSLVIDEEDETPTLPDGSPIDGSGIGIALVDSGLDATHPAFEDKVTANKLVTPAGVVAGGPYTVQGSPHGTNLAGIAAGNGAGSGDRDLRGAAPGASLTMLATWVPGTARPIPTGIAETFVQPTTLHAAVAFDWILQHGDEQDPPIQVVVNGWSCQASPCKEANPEMAHVQLASELAEQGVVVLFAVGDRGGDGVDNRVSVEARIPTQGVMGVTNHDDEETGTRTDCIKGSASRGFGQDPATWPDIAAPGDDVSTTQAAAPEDDTRVPGLERKSYVQVDGSSAATAHLAGVVALVLQANPSLQPHEVEYVLESTAHELPQRAGESCPVAYLQSDPSNPWDGANFAAGHGLVDAVDAVQLALDFPGIPDTEPTLEEIPPDFDGLFDRVGVDIGTHLYLAGEDSLDTTRPTDERSQRRVLRPNEAATFTSQPLTDPVRAEGIDAAVFAGAVPEGGGGTYDFFVRNEFEVQVERISDGNVLDSTTGTVGLHTFPPETALQRGLTTVLDEPIEFDAGDQVRVTVRLVDRGAAGEESAISHWVLAWDGREHPSHVGLGSVVDPAPHGSEAECRVDADCAWLDADHPSAYAECEEGLNRVTFTGPPGSRAFYRCPYGVATCEVPDQPGDQWGTCKAELWLPQGADIWTKCSFDSPDGSMEGFGSCAPVDEKEPLN